MTFDVQRFVADARELATQGIRSRHMRSDPSIGLDCINVVRYVYELQGLVLPEELADAFLAYHPETDGMKMFYLMEKYLITVEIPAAQIGDLYLFRTKKCSRHVAIKVQSDPTWIVEAHEKKLLDWPLDSLRARLIVAAFRIPATL